MKKLILTNVLALLAVVTFGQSSKTSNNDVPKELTINGIPYTQYKAQQDALKQKQAAENKAAATQAPAANAVTNTHATAQQNVQQAPVLTKQANVSAPAAAQPYPFPQGTVANKQAPVAGQPAITGTSVDPNLAPAKHVDKKTEAGGSVNSTNNALVAPAPSKQIHYVTPQPVNNTKPVEVPAQKIENAKDKNVPAAKPLIGNPVEVNAELLKEKAKGKE